MFAVLFKNREVRRLFIADNISIIGDYFSYVALAGLVKEITDSNFLVSLVYVAFTMPFFFTTPFAGPVIDKFNRRNVIVLVSLLQAGCAVGFLFASDSRIWIAFVAQIGITALGAFVNPSFSAALPNVCRDDEELHQANALFGSSWGAMVFIGAAAGGLFSQAFGRTATFVADIATFVICAGLVALVKAPMQESRGEHHSTVIRPIADMKEAFQYAKRDHTILALMASKTTFAIGAGAVSQLAVLAIDAFGKGDGGTGLILAARGVGAAVGPYVVMRLVKNNLPRLLSVCGYAGLAYAFFYICAAASPNILFACLFIFGAHFGGGAQWTLSSYGLQVRAPDSIRGRVLSADYAIATLMMGISSIVAGVLGEFLPIRVSIAIMGFSSGVAAVVYIVGTAKLRARLRTELPQQ